MRRALGAKRTATIVLLLPASVLAQTPKPASVTVSPARLFYGQGATVTVQLDRAAPAGGASVNVYPCNSNAYRPDPSRLVTIPAGQSSTSFSVTANPQGSGWGSAQNCIRAQIGTDVAVSNAVEMGMLATHIALPVAEAYGGARLSGEVRMGTLSSSSSGGPATVLGGFPAFQDVPITLGSAGGITFPSGTQVTIRAGTTSVPFACVLPEVLYDQETRVTKAGGGPFNTFAIVRTKVNNVAAASVSPSTLQGGGNATGTVILYGPAGPGGARVAVEVIGVSASLPREVTVPEGATSVTFPIQLGTVTNAVDARLRAGRAVPSNWSSALPPKFQATFRVNPGQGSNLSVAEVSVDPATVRGGQPSTGRVRLSGNAPAGGINVVLYRMGGCCADIPAGVKVPGGSDHATFAIGTVPQDETTRPEIQAALFSSWKSALLTVTSVQVDQVEVPSSVYGGSSLTVKVKLTSPGPADRAIAFALTSTDPAGVPVPAQLLVPAGQQEGAVTVKTLSTPVDKTITVRVRNQAVGLDRTFNIAVRKAPPMAAEKAGRPMVPLGKVSSKRVLPLQK